MSHETDKCFFSHIEILGKLFKNVVGKILDVLLMYTFFRILTLVHSESAYIKRVTAWLANITYYQWNRHQFYLLIECIHTFSHIQKKQLEHNIILHYTHTVQAHFLAYYN